jgi:hypothetical protein
MSGADVLSYGGGRQTVALCVLIAQGKLPRPERIVCADTGREAGSTWDYLRDHVAPLLATEGLSVEIARHHLAAVDLYGTNGDLLIPAYTREGKLPTFCSTEWKRRPVRRWLRANGYGPEKPVSLWLGISADEVGRAKPSDCAWLTHRFPLLFDFPMGLDKRDCVRIVRAAGLPEPPRSSCWMCPHRSDEEWKALSSDDFDKAIALESDIQDRDTQGGVWLHRDRVKLAGAILTEPETDLPLFGKNAECESGYCFI